MVGVGRHAEADDLGMNPRAARPRRFQWLQHKHSRALAQNHAAAVFGKGPAGIRRNYAHGLPGLENAEAKRRFAAARNGKVSNALANHPKSLADSVPRRGASGRNGKAGTRDAEFHGDVAGARVRHGLWNCKWVDAVVAQFVDL